MNCDVGKELCPRILRSNSRQLKNDIPQKCEFKPICPELPTYASRDIVCITPRAISAPNSPSAS